MKKNVFFAMLIILLLFCSCERDPYKGKRPIDQPNTRWECSEYNMWFYIADGWDISMGEMVIQGEIAEFTFMFNAFSNDVSFIYDYSETAEHLTNYSTYFSGDCKFYYNKFIVHVTHDNEGVFPDGELPVLTFYKVKDKA